MTFPIRLPRAWFRACALLFTVALLACTPPKPPAQPGVIIRTEPVPGAPANATAIRIIYGTTAPDGSGVEASALVIVPAMPAPPDGRPIVSWLHPTTGVATACAPSQGPSPFGQIQGLSMFLSRGYLVVATDYPGLGTPGAHPYLVGVSEARAGLDAVRAARKLPDAQGSNRFAVWGHSQGGHAALFTPGIAASYAPDLHLVGVAAAAPVTDLAALLTQPAEDPLWGALLSYTVWSWSQTYGLKQSEIVALEAEPIVARAAAECLQTREQLTRIVTDTAPLSRLPVTPSEGWRGAMIENGPRPWSSGVPAFLAQGARDPVIDPMLTRAFAQRLCSAGIPVRYVSMSRGDHFTAGVRSAGAAATWITERFADRPPRDDCGGAALR